MCSSAFKREFLHSASLAAAALLCPAAGVQLAPDCCSFFASGWLSAVGHGQTADGVSQQLPEGSGAPGEGVAPSAQSAPGAVTAAADAALHAERDADARRKWCSFRHVCGVAMYQEEEEVRTCRALPQTFRSFHFLQMGFGASDPTSAWNATSWPWLAAWKLLQMTAVLYPRPLSITLAKQSRSLCVSCIQIHCKRQAAAVTSSGEGEVYDG